MNQHRKEKIQNMTRKIIAQFISQDLPDEDKIFWLINISEIILSSDYSYLDVFVSGFNNIDQLTKTLATHAHKLQRIIWKEIWLRKSPKIRFRYDEMWEVGSKIQTEINTLDTENLEKKLSNNS